VKLSIEEMDAQNRGILAVAIADCDEESWLKKTRKSLAFWRMEGEAGLSA